MSGKYKHLIDPSEAECKALLQQLVLNDYNAFNRIYALYYAAVRTYAEKFVAGEAAEEAAHEVFIRIWEKRQFDNWPHLIGFMYLTARNYCLTVLDKKSSENKNRKEYALHLLTGLSEHELNIHDQVLHMRLKDAINSELSGKKKKTVELLLQGYKITEVAAKLNIAKETAQNYKSLAFSLLRQKLKMALRLFWFL